MHLHPVLTVAVMLVAGAPGPIAGTGRGVPAEQRPPDAPESLRDLCHGSDLCWRLILTPPRNGPFLVQAKFPDSKRFVRPEDAYCDRREYWHVVGSAHTLLAVDCAEQWGPDSQGPVRVSIERGKITLTYLEWQYDDDCEKAVAVFDLGTSKLVSFKRWAGVASANRTDCRHLKLLKAPLPGDGKTTPIARFRADAIPDAHRPAR
jgi:hypothetical protein